MKLNEVEAKYLKRIYEAVKEEGGIVTSYELAKHFGVRTPSSIDVLNRLQRKGLVIREAWGPVMLTEEGLKLAKMLLHVHRVMEYFFCESLGLPPDLACLEASKIDYLISDEVAKRICDRMNRPLLCPHGRVIPHEHG